MKIRIDSIFKFADPYFDEVQGEYTWGIVDMPEPIRRDDDQFYIWRESDRLDLVAFKLLGDPRHLFIIMHYNQIIDAMDTQLFVGKTLRIPSRDTLERIYINAGVRSSDS